MAGMFGMPEGFGKPLLSGKTEEERKKSRRTLIKAKRGFERERLGEIKEAKKKGEKRIKRFKKKLKERPFKPTGFTARRERFRNLM